MVSFLHRQVCDESLILSSKLQHIVRVFLCHSHTCNESPISIGALLPNVRVLTCHSKICDLSSIQSIMSQHDLTNPWHDRTCRRGSENLWVFSVQNFHKSSLSLLHVPVPTQIGERLSCQEDCRAQHPDNFVCGPDEAAHLVAENGGGAAITVHYSGPDTLGKEILMPSGWHSAGSCGHKEKQGPPPLPPASPVVQISPPQAWPQSVNPDTMQLRPGFQMSAYYIRHHMQTIPDLTL